MSGARSKRELHAVPEPLRSAARRYAEELRSRLGDRLRSVRLFGSFAIGREHFDSDCDIAVVVDRLDWEQRRALIDLASDISIEAGLRSYLSPTILDAATYATWREQERPLVRDIEAEGIPL